MLAWFSFLQTTACTIVDKFIVASSLNSELINNYHKFLVLFHTIFAFLILSWYQKLILYEKGPIFNFAKVFIEFSAENIFWFIIEMAILFLCKRTSEIRRKNENITEYVGVLCWQCQHRIQIETIYSVQLKIAGIGWITWIVCLNSFGLKTLKKYIFLP